MSTSVLLRPRNGLGDKLLDVYGFLTWSRAHDGAIEPVLDWCTTDDYQPWGNARYHPDLFAFPCRLGQGPEDVVVTSTDPSASFCPERVQGYLRASSAEMPSQYVETAASIRVSPRVVKKAPPAIESCVGIHLRRKDKVRSGGDLRHETEPEELGKLMEDVWKYVDELLAHGTRHFFVCGDDAEVINEFRDKLLAKDSSVHIALPDYESCELPGEADVLDWYCLTRCWKIVQGIKYSSFSVSAAVASQAPLVNFANHESTALLHLWRSCLVLEAHGELARPLPATTCVREATFASWARHKWRWRFARC